MSKERKIIYFEKTGSANTVELAGIVANRVEEGDIDAIAVATGTGGTALAIVEAVPKGTRVYAVNFQSASKKPDAEIRAKAEARGAVFMPTEPVAKYLKDVEGHSPDSLRRLGQGMKVSCEVVMQATEVGHLKKGERVIGIGGTSRGADVAIVALAAGPAALSDLWVSEVLAKPL